VTNGVACTTTSLIAAALGYEDIRALSAQQVATIKKAHLLLVMYNAFQPGVFALSGWDLVGALPLEPDQVAHLMEDGDTRWIARGAYDLTGAVPEATQSADGLPRAPALYGPITTQLEDPNSFASQLKKLLAVRDAYGIAVSEQVAIPDVKTPGLLVMVHDLPDRRGLQVTALNFGQVPVDETVVIDVPGAGPVFDMIGETIAGEMTAEGELHITLAPLEGRALRIAYPLPTDTLP
jgi:trehalose synthase